MTKATMPSDNENHERHKHALERKQSVKITVREFLDDTLNTNSMHKLLGEQVLTISLCIKRVRLNIVYDVQNATYSSHGVPCPARDLSLWLNTRVKVHISVWTISEYPERYSSYLSDSRDTFLPLTKKPPKLRSHHDCWPTKNRSQYCLNAST